MKNKNFAANSDFLDLLLDVVCVVDASGHFVFVSAASERVFGYKPEEMVGKAMIEMVVPEDREMTLNAVSDIMTGHPKSGLENRYLRKDGRVIHVMWSARWYEADQVRIAVGRDITEQSASQAKLVEREQRFRALFESSPDPAWIMDEHRFVECNQAAIALFGCHDREAFLNVHPSEISPQFQPDGEDSFSKAERMMSIADNQGLNRFEWVHKRMDGHEFFAEVTLAAIDIQGRHGIYAVVRDITQRVEAEDAVQRESEKNLALLRNASDGIHILDAAGNLVEASDSFCAMLGYERTELLGSHVSKWDAELDETELAKLLAQQMENPVRSQFETHHRRKDGSRFAVEVSGTPVLLHGRKLLFNSSRDISERKVAEEKINHLAYRDALTDLPNRALLKDRIEQSIATAHREHGTVALLFLDLDHFKNINDSFGHAIGDHLLVEIARRLSSLIRETDTVGRLGGDEFLIVLPGADAGAAAYVAQKLLEESVRSFVVDGHNLTITTSLGIAIYPKDGSNFDELLKASDTAMYRAKGEGRNTYRFYTQEMNRVVFQRMVLESNLHHAIDKSELMLLYQPKYDLRNQTLVGAEALLRWNQPEMGVVPPGLFIPVAEESGLIGSIGKWVLKDVCRQVKAWIDLGLPRVRIAVNVSARQFAARNIVEMVAEALNSFGLSGACLEIEITESLLAQDMDYTLDALQHLQKLGVHVSVDDFGTGYSSLSYLKRFPIDRLKIDQSFVRDLETDADDRAIATAVVTLGHSLGMRVIAEGVETQQQMEILREMGCDEIQGYYLGRPVRADEMALLLK